MKRIKILSNLILGIATSAFALQLLAKTATEDLAERLKTYETFQGNFNQTVTDSTGELLQQSSGTFNVKSPGYFYWDTLQPFPQKVIANLKSIWLYDPDLEQVTVSPYSDSVDQSPALLLSGNVEKITENYSVERIESPVNGFVLTPKANSSNFTELRLIFTEAVLTTMILTDSLEQTTTFNFDAIKINQPIDSALFEFEPPTGVDILKND